MPNVTSVWDFSPGETLTAAKLDDVNCGIHVFSGTATRDAAYGGSGERALSEGEFAYLADTNTTQYYDGAAWQTVGGGLTLIKAQTIGTTVSSVTVSDVFSATYNAYKIIIEGGAASTSNVLLCQLGATTTGYYYATTECTYAGSAGNNNGANVGNFRCGAGETGALSGEFDIFNPFAADETWAVGQYCVPRTTGSAVTHSAFLNNTTSYTAFTILTTTGTLTGGTIRVYGYQNS